MKLEILVEVPVLVRTGAALPTAKDLVEHRSPMGWRRQIQKVYVKADMANASVSNTGALILTAQGGEEEPRLVKAFAPGCWFSVEEIVEEKDAEK